MKTVFLTVGMLCMFYIADAQTPQKGTKTDTSTYHRNQNGNYDQNGMNHSKSNTGTNRQTNRTSSDSTHNQKNHPNNGAGHNNYDGANKTYKPTGTDTAKTKTRQPK